MKIGYWLLAGALLMVSTHASADDEVDQSEDPFADGEETEREDAEDEEEVDSEESEYIDEEKRTFGRSGDFVISAERLIGFAKTSQEVEVEGGPDRSSDVTRTHLLLNAGGSDFMGYSAPRVGLDLFISEGVSLGALVGYSSDSGPYDFRLFLAGGRVGYAHMFSKVLGIWGRAGITYSDAKADDVKLALLAAGGDVQLAVVPSKNVIVLLGPRLDVSFLGKLDPPDGEKLDARANEFGFSAGFGLFF